MAARPNERSATHGSLSALLTAAALTLAPSAAAHGGQYRGPGDMKPPGNSGGGSSAPATVGGGSSTGSPLVPAGPRAAPTRGTGAAAGAASGASRGAFVGPDLTRWQFWWEFNKDRYLGLRAALRRKVPVKDSDIAFLSGQSEREESRPPTAREVQKDVVPALLAVLETSDQRDIVSGTLMALAKTCRGRAIALPPIRARLSAANQEIRETAALCLGLAGAEAALDDLLHLCHDDAEGRRLVERQRVDHRTRAFAIYGLGLLGSDLDDRSRRRIVDAVAVHIDPEVPTQWDVRLASIQALRIIGSATGKRAFGRTLRAAIASKLNALFAADLGEGERAIQAHALPAVAAVLRRGPASERAAFLHRMRAILDANRGTDPTVLQGAALALGIAASANSGDKPTLRILTATAQKCIDHQARYYAIMGLSRSGGDDARQALLDLLTNGNQLTRCWTALALGLAAADSGTVADPQAIALIRRRYAAASGPEERAAYAIALGLHKDTASAPLMRERLRKYRHQDDYAGYLCIALGLLGDTQSTALVRDVVMTSSRRPQLMVQASTALGLLGDRDVTRLLMDTMRGADTGVAVMGSLAIAVGQMGDHRTIEPLTEMLLDEDQLDLARAFAAVGLGAVGDPRELPWNAGLGSWVNYRSAVPSLTNQASGVLDLF